MNKTVITLALILSSALGGIVADRYVFNSMTTSMSSGTSSTESDEDKVAYWVAPMDANFRKDSPGKSPMGMDLVPIYEKDTQNTGNDDNAVFLSPAVINNLGVRTETVTESSFSYKINSVGYVAFDETKISHIHLRTEGWVEKLYVNAIGQRIKKGDALFDVYSPEMVNAQSDYLNALSTGRRNVINASKTRMRALNISNDIIKTITKTRKIQKFIKVRAPQDGIITTLNIADGMHITAMTTAISLADLSSVWLIADFFESQASWIQEGLNAEVKMPYKADKIWHGKITYIYPQIDPITRTLKARLEFDNTDEALKPNMYANVTLMGQEKPNTLTISQEAIIYTATSKYVILSLGDGKFQPAEIETGLTSNDRIEVIKGLEVGEKIVTSAQFLIDSEASLIGTKHRMIDNTPKQDDMKSMDGMTNMDDTSSHPIEGASHD